MKRGKLDLL